MPDTTLPTPAAPPRTNDGTDAPPRLELFLNMGNLSELPAWSSAPKAEGAELYAAIKAAGFSGVQGADAGLAHAAGLMVAGGGRVNTVGEAERVCVVGKDDGAVCSTLHVGWGMEDDATLDALVGDILDASTRHGFPLYIETHRATITQDMWRTVQLTERIPEVRFNADFSHYYTGQEMPYGDFDDKLAFLQPVFDRIGFMHGRIGNPQNIQVSIGSSVDEALSRPFVQHFGQMWSAVFAHFKADAKPGDYLAFAPELLHPSIHYARSFVDPATGQLREECDRWAEALVMAELVREWFDAA